jgi:hypothetical protein
MRHDAEIGESQISTKLGAISPRLSRNSVGLERLCFRPIWVDQILAEPESP